MHLVERSALVTYTPSQMFALVNDIARYPEFLPWCVGARVEEVSAAERVATLKVARGVLQTDSPRATPCSRTPRSTCSCCMVPSAIWPANGVSRP